MNARKLIKKKYEKDMVLPTLIPHGILITNDTDYHLRTNSKVLVAIFNVGHLKTRISNKLLNFT